MPKKRNIVLGYLAGIILLILLFGYIGIDNIVNALSGFELFYLLPALAVFVLVLLVNALILRILISNVKGISFGFVFRKFLLSFAAGAMLPSRAGEFSFALLAKEKIPMGKSSAAQILDKLVAIAVKSVFAVAGIFFFFGAEQAIQVAVVALVFIPVVITIILSDKVREFLKKTILSRFAHHFTGFSTQFKSYFFENKKLLAVNVLLMAMKTFLQALIPFFLFRGFGVNIELMVLVYIISINQVLAIFFISPQGLGLKQTVMVFLLGLLGVSATTTASVSIISFGIDYGYVALVVLGAMLLNVKLLVREKEKSEGLENHRKKLLLSCGAIKSKEQELTPIIEVKEFHGTKLAGICGLVRRHFIIPTLYLAVDEEFQGKGLGTKLVKELLNKTSGPIFLTVTKDDSPQKRIYEKTGFKKLIGWRKIRGVKTVVMAKW